MADRPDGKPAGTERVLFTRPAAERISRVVRAFEAGSRDAQPLTFDVRSVAGGSSKTFRVATTTHAWAQGDTATLTFYNVTTTPNTVVATNLHFGVKGSGTIECMIAKDGTAWYLAGVNLTKLQSYAAGEIQLLGHDDEGYGRWYSVSTCSTSTAS